MNCKPGDLAILVRSDASSNLGAIVEVVRPWIFETDAWWVKPTRPLVTESGFPASEGWVFDRQIKPISGIPVDDEMTEDLKEPA